jgi:hypothetical protein
LLQGQFIRAGFWFAAGGWMLMWWFHDRLPEQDLSFDKIVPWALTWMVIGACFTGAAWIIKRKMAQAQEDEVELALAFGLSQHSLAAVLPLWKCRRLSMGAGDGVPDETVSFRAAAHVRRISCYIR